MDRAHLIWIGIAIAALVYFDLLFLELRKLGREAARMQKRIDGFAALPVIGAVEQAQRDGARITHALEAMPELIERGRAALPRR